MKMEPRITEEKQFTLLGCVFYGDPFHSSEEWSIENEIGKLWQKFIELFGKRGKEIKNYVINPDIFYEVHLMPDDYKKTKKYYIFVGVEVKDIKEIPMEMFLKSFPKVKYAIFTFKGKDMFTGSEYIYNEWLPNSKYKDAHPYQIQAYDSKRHFGLDNEKSELDYYIPIK